MRYDHFTRVLWVLFLLVSTGFSAPLDIDDGASFHALDATEMGTKNQAVCRQCHMVDFTAKDQAPQLWAKAKPMEKSSIRNLEVTPEEPDAFSIACLSCHDGSSASNVMNAPISPCGLKGTGAVTDRGANHPVFLKYPDFKPDLQGQYMALNGEWSDASTVSDLLRDEQIVCVSCHVPHHSDKAGYLRTTMRGSALCIGCHKK